MKKFLATICAAALLMTGCGGEQVADKPNNNFSGESVKLGMITRLNTDEKTMGDVLDKALANLGVTDIKNVPKFYESFNQMQMGLEAGDIEAINTYQSVANYLVANNDKFEITPHDAFNKLSDYFCFAVRKEDKDIKVKLDKVIDEMKADGSLDKLINDYITNLEKGKTPPAVEIPMTEGADTIKVGITGDLPPLDLILPDNSPAGFNTALLAEIAKRSGVNISLVEIDSNARAAALNSKLIDVVFWVIVPFGNDMPIDLDKPEGLELSAPYFKDTVAVVKLKSNK